MVHPFERLRYVARAGSVPDRYLVPETVEGLDALVHQHATLFVALRALLTRQPDSVGLITMAATLLTALDPTAAARDLIDSFEQDPTWDHAEHVGEHESSGCIVVDSVGSGPDSVLCPNGTEALVAHAVETGRSTAIVTPFGSRLPTGLWQFYLQRTAPGRGDGLGGEVHPLSLFDELIGPEGPAILSTWHPDCAEAPEITRW